MATEGKLKLAVVTHEAKLLDIECDEVTVPGLQGELGILPGHTPMLSALGAGVLAYRTGSRAEHLVVFSGFCEILDNQVTILTDSAQWPKDVDAESSRKEASEAEKELLAATDDSWEEAKTRLDHAQAQLRVLEHKN